MQETTLMVRKRDGRVEPYLREKLCLSLTAAALAVVNDEFRDDSACEGILSVLGMSKDGDDDIQSVVKEAYARGTIGDELYDSIELVAELVETAVEETGEIVPTSTLSEIVHTALVEAGQGALLREYVMRAASRERAIEGAGALMHAVREMTFMNSQHSNAKRDNANVNGETAMGTMLQYGSAASKTFALNDLIPKHIADEHAMGSIHIHDLEFYALTLTCCQIDIEKLFEGGFNTGHGHIRTPASIESYAALTCIAIQSNQNDQHGGQSIPALDFYLEKGVAKTLATELAECVRADYEMVGKLTDAELESMARNIKAELFDYIQENRHLYTDAGKAFSLSVVEKYAPDCVSTFDKIWNIIRRRTERRTRQAMESLVHNLNSMHSRAGAQIPFSSINFGTATSWEGRLIIFMFLEAVEVGLGNGETPIFPISIFKMKSGVNVYPGDPNYDLFKKAIHVTSRRMYPNFSNLDAPYNLQYYQEGNVASEAAYMGCRTRVVADINGPNEVTGRGNLSFTTINLPQMALRAQRSIPKFYDMLTYKLNLVLEQLLSRLDIVSHRRVANMPFLMQQHVWRGTENLQPEDEVAPALKHGTVSIGFAGLAEALVALTGKHHGESDEAQKLGLEIISYMRNFCDEKTKELMLNVTLLATPAESACGRFLNIDRKEFGVVPGVTDHEYYTNSFHVPVWYKTSARHKVEIEAPYHALTNAGHIAYVELDGAACDNEQAVEDLVMLMYNKGCGYFAVSHAVDFDPVCGYTGYIGNGPCPKCGRNEFENVPFKRSIQETL